MKYKYINISVEICRFLCYNSLNIYYSTITQVTTAHQNSCRKLRSCRIDKMYVEKLKGLFAPLWNI